MNRLLKGVWRVLLGVLVVFPCSYADAQVKTPCFKQDSRGRWKPTASKDCVMYTLKQFRSVVDRLAQLEHYKKQYEPACELAKKEHGRLDLNWKRASGRWGRQVKHYGNLIMYNQKEAKTWRDAFYKLKDQKVPPKSWTQSPWLWFGVGVGVTVAVVVGTVAAVNALQTQPSTNTSPLLVAH